jgi:hypothetical protein
MATIQDQEGPTVYLTRTAYDMSVRTLSNIVEAEGAPISGDAITRTVSPRIKALKAGKLWEREADRDTQARVSAMPKLSFEQFLASYA